MTVLELWDMLPSKTTINYFKGGSELKEKYVKKEDEVLNWLYDADGCSVIVFLK